MFRFLRDFKRSFRVRHAGTEVPAFREHANQPRAVNNRRHNAQLEAIPRASFSREFETFLDEGDRAAVLAQQVIALTDPVEQLPLNASVPTFSSQMKPRLTEFDGTPLLAGQEMVIVFNVWIMVSSS